MTGEFGTSPTLAVGTKWDDDHHVYQTDMVKLP